MLCNASYRLAARTIHCLIVFAHEQGSLKRFQFGLAQNFKTCAWMSKPSRCWQVLCWQAPLAWAMPLVRWCKLVCKAHTTYKQICSRGPDCIIITWCCNDLQTLQVLLWLILLCPLETLARIWQSHLLHISRAYHCWGIQQFGLCSTNMTWRLACTSCSCLAIWWHCKE